VRVTGAVGPTLDYRTGMADARHAARRRASDGAVAKPADRAALIAELVGHSAELAQMAHENAAMLVRLWAEHAAAPPLDADVLEIAALQAQAAGVSVEEWLRDAVLAHADRSRAPADREPHGRAALRDASGPRAAAALRRSPDGVADHRSAADGTPKRSP
jgi:hypothetical protein